MEQRILILFAHPRVEKSRANLALTRSIPPHPDITFHDLYERYPDFNVDVAYEKKLLLDHSVIIWHHPFYWYSAPPLLKQWIDMVLEFGWAYGPGGTALKGKVIFNAITTGGAGEVYNREGYNRFTIREFLAPFDQTAHLCKMIYLPPFAVQGTHRLTHEHLLQKAGQYSQLLLRLLEGRFRPEGLQQYLFLNDWITQTQDVTI